jgi:hypothetical protein
VPRGAGAPSTPERVIVLRRISAVQGPARVQVALAAGAGFDRHGMARLRQDEGGAWSAELGETRMRWLGAEEAKPTDGSSRERALTMELELEPGEERDLVLALQQGEAPIVPLERRSLMSPSYPRGVLGSRACPSTDIPWRGRCITGCGSGVVV